MKKHIFLKMILLCLSLNIQAKTQKSEAKAIKKCYDTYSEYILEASQKYKVDQKLILAVILVESTCNARAKGVYGEVGLMQIYPKWHPDAHFNPRKNILKGASILSQMKKYCGKKFVRCYNAGLGSSRNTKGTLYEKRVHKYLAKIADTFIYFYPGELINDKQRESIADGRR